MSVVLKISLYLTQHYRMAQLTVDWKALLILQHQMIYWVLNFFLNACTLTIWYFFFCFATMIRFMEIVCVPQAHDEFLVNLCLVVVICPDSFKEVIVVKKVPDCGIWRVVACKSNETKNKLFTDLNFEVFGFVFWSNDNVAAFTTFSSRIW